jgi:hypothetical protein
VQASLHQDDQDSERRTDGSARKRCPPEAKSAAATRQEAVDGQQHGAGDYSGHWLGAVHDGVTQRVRVEVRQPVGYPADLLGLLSPEDARCTALRRPSVWLASWSGSRALQR